MVPSQILIIGGGLAGLFCALKLAPSPVTVMINPPLVEGAASYWAQGGIAAALSEGDTPERHAQDTIAAGYGLVEPDIALRMTLEARARIEDLLVYGVPFDQDQEGHFLQSREAAHSLKRVARVKGDMAGKAIMSVLRHVVENTPSITLAQGYHAHSLCVHEGRVVGAQAYDTNGENVHFAADAVVLATGGIGHLYALTTNPPESCALGLAMAARAGAIIADAEFVQFHPTALDVGRDPAPLATEALRGEGAYLVNNQGTRFMAALHPDADLAPRDVVARGVFEEVLAGRGAFLDARAAIGDEFPTRFSAVFAACQAAGLDPRRDLIPVAPAEHYHMGGVLTDSNGRTNVPGLWAAGEVASTGVHGANRLASNSLLEAAVFATRVAQDILARVNVQPSPSDIKPSVQPVMSREDEVRDALLLEELRALNTRYVGVIRDGQGLNLAIDRILGLASRAKTIKVKSMMLSSLFIALAAQQRQESRGAHFRADFPMTDPSQTHRTFQQLRDVQAVLPVSSQFWDDLCP